MNIYFGNRNELGEAWQFCFPDFWTNRKARQEAKVIDSASSIVVRANHGPLLAVLLFQAADGIFSIKRFVARALADEAGIEIAEFLRGLAHRNKLKCILFETEFSAATDELLKRCGFVMKAYNSTSDSDGGLPAMATWSLPLFAEISVMEKMRA